MVAVSVLQLLFFQNFYPYKIKSLFIKVEGVVLELILTIVDTSIRDNNTRK